MSQATQLNEDVPSTLLGQKYAKWTMANLFTILGHYGKSHSQKPGKKELWRLLGDLPMNVDWI